MFVHNVLYIVVTLYSGSAVAFTNLGASFTETGLVNRRQDLALGMGFTECRCTVSGNGTPAASTLGQVDYSTDGGATDAGVLVTCPASNLATSIRAGSWTSIPTGARRDVTLMFGFSNGDGAGDPGMGSMRLECRSR